MEKYMAIKNGGGDIWRGIYGIWLGVYKIMQIGVYMIGVYIGFWRGIYGRGIYGIFGGVYMDL